MDTDIHKVLKSAPRVDHSSNVVRTLRIIEETMVVHGTPSSRTMIGVAHVIFIKTQEDSFPSLSVYSTQPFRYLL